MSASTRLLASRWASVALLLGALSLGGCNADCLGDFCENTPAEDAAARGDYYKQAAKTYYDGGRYDASASMWDKVLIESPDDQWAKFGLAKSLHMMGSVRSLRRAENILVDILPLNWVHQTRGDVKFEVQTTLANVYASLADYYDRDLRVIENRLANDPNCKTDALQKQLTCQERKRDELLRKSIPLWNAVLCKSPDNPYALAGLSKAHLTVGNEQMGIHYANRYIALSRKSQVQWRKKLSQWQCQMKGDVSAEQRAFYMDKIHGARDKELGMHLLLGSVFMRRENFTKAVESYDEVVALDPAVPAAYVERAQAYAALGLYPQAVKDLERYLKMTDPEKQRNARVSAAELLDRYRLILERSSARRTPAPAPSPGAPARGPSAQAYGNPDG